MLSAPACAFASWIAARSVQTPLPGPVSQMWLPGATSTASMKLLTTMAGLGAAGEASPLRGAAWVPADVLPEPVLPDGTMPGPASIPEPPLICDLPRVVLGVADDEPRSGVAGRASTIETSSG